MRRRKNQQLQQKKKMDYDGPLDFESEDVVVSAPIQDTKKRRKVIGLDDLLTDYYKERSKLVEKEYKKKSVEKCYNSDDDEDKTRKNKEALLSKFVDNCQNQVRGLVSEDEIPSWGQKIFGKQKALPSLDPQGLGSCKLLQSFIDSEVNLVVELKAEKAGQSFIEGLLKNGWLSKLVFAIGYLEDSVASWTFNTMLYSSNEDLQTPACDFWLAILKDKVDQQSIRLEWFPSYGHLKDALETYGYLFYTSINASSVLKGGNSDFGPEGPPPNIRSWVKFLCAYCKTRSIDSTLSTSEVEELVGVIISFFLDRKLEALSLLFDECLQTAISFFTESEWILSSMNIAHSLACRIPKDFNCLRMVECISGVCTRSKQLRSEVAFQILSKCLEMKITDAEVVLRSLLSISVKGKECDFFNIYIYLLLAENWLISSTLLEQKPLILEMWCLLLRNYSCQITSTDWRSYASKVRNKASYLLQNVSQICD